MRSHRVASSRSFGLTFTGLFFAVGALDLAYNGRGYGWLAVGVILLLISVFIPRVLAPLKGLWLKLGHLLSAVVNPIVLGLVYVFAITLTGGILRIFKKDLLSLRHDPVSSSYWILRKPGPDPESIKEQF